jgi:P-type Cu+ transporter
MRHVGCRTVVPSAVRLARRTHGTVRTNLSWAFAYNLAALAAGRGRKLNPIIAGRGDDARPSSW